MIYLKTKLRRTKHFLGATIKVSLLEKVTSDVKLDNPWTMDIWRWRNKQTDNGGEGASSIKNGVYTEVTGYYFLAC